MLHLLDLAHHKAHDAVKRGGPVYVLVNPVEFHGPHLSLHNDRLLSLGLTRLLHARLSPPDAPLLLLDDVEIGMDPAPGRGTRHHSFATVRAIIMETCRALLELEPQGVIFMTFHGAPMHAAALQAGVEFLRSKGVAAVNPFNAVLQEMLEFKDPSRYREAYAHLPEQDAAQMLQTLNQDFHAGFFETSMALHLAPQSVSDIHLRLPPCPAVVPDGPLLQAARAAALLGRFSLARDLRFAAYGLGWQWVRPFPGYTGHPARASAASGAVFTRAILDLYVPLVRAVLAGTQPPPRPIMPWIPALTLQGRIPHQALPGPADMAAPPLS